MPVSYTHLDVYKRQAQADALGAEVRTLLGVVGGVRIGKDLQLTVFVRPAHKAVQVGVFSGGDSGDLALIDIAGGAVDGDKVALVEDLAVDGEGLGVVIDDHVVGVAAAADTAGAHAAGNDGRVAGHAAAHGEESFNFCVGYTFLYERKVCRFTFIITYCRDIH